jgi:hypothetical protein
VRLECIALLLLFIEPIDDDNRFEMLPQANVLLHVWILVFNALQIEASLTYWQQKRSVCDPFGLRWHMRVSSMIDGLRQV